MRVTLFGGPWDGYAGRIPEPWPALEVPVAGTTARYVKGDRHVEVDAGEPTPYFYEPLPLPLRRELPSRFGQR